MPERRVADLERHALRRHVRAVGGGARSGPCPGTPSAGRACWPLRSTGNPSCRPAGRPRSSRARLPTHPSRRARAPRRGIRCGSLRSAWRSGCESRCVTTLVRSVRPHLEDGADHHPVGETGLSLVAGVGDVDRSVLRDVDALGKVVGRLQGRDCRDRLRGPGRGTVPALEGHAPDRRAVLVVEVPACERHPLGRERLPTNVSAESARPSWLSSGSTRMAPLAARRAAGRGLARRRHEHVSARSGPQVAGSRRGTRSGERRSPWAP